MDQATFDQEDTMTDPQLPETSTPASAAHGRKHPSRQATPTNLRALEKRADAIRLRIGGMSYDEIARRLGYSDRTGAFKAVEAGRKAIISEPAEELVTMEAERLDAMLTESFDVLAEAKTAGEGELILKAVDRVVRISESRRRLLGLDAPTRTDVTAAGAGSIQVVFDPALMPGGDG